MTKRFLVLDLDTVDTSCFTNDVELARYLAKKWSREYSWWRRILRWLGGI